MIKNMAFKFIETETEGGKLKSVQIIDMSNYEDIEIIADFPAKLFHKWLKEKVREMEEWMKTGKVKKWYNNEIKIDKDRLRYMG